MEIVILIYIVIPIAYFVGKREGIKQAKKRNV